MADTDITYASQFDRAAFAAVRSVTRPLMEERPITLAVHAETFARLFKSVGSPQHLTQDDNRRWFWRGIPLEQSELLLVRPGQVRARIVLEQIEEI